MAKKTKDQFDIFKQVTLGTSTSLSSLNVDNKPAPVKETPLPSPATEVKDATPAPAQKVDSTEKVSKNANRELVSFHISKEIKKKLNLLKVETEKSLGDLYNEAIDDLLVKYNMR